MSRSQLLGVAVASALLGSLGIADGSLAASAQGGQAMQGSQQNATRGSASDQGQSGCTTANGQKTGKGCNASSMANGMPATKHQKQVLKNGQNAQSNGNMAATGAGGSQMPATQHQTDVLQKQGGNGQ